MCVGLCTTMRGCTATGGKAGGEGNTEAGSREAQGGAGGSCTQGSQSQGGATTGSAVARYQKGAGVGAERDHAEGIGTGKTEVDGRLLGALDAGAWGLLCGGSTAKMAVLLQAPPCEAAAAGDVCATPAHKYLQIVLLLCKVGHEPESATVQ
jgi:hypothetical protein